MANFCDEFFKKTNSDTRKRELFIELAKKLGVKPYLENEKVIVARGGRDYPTDPAKKDLLRYNINKELQIAGLINAVKSDKAKAVAADLALSWDSPTRIFEMRVIVEMMKKNIFDERISEVIDDLHSGFCGEPMLCAAFEIVRADNIRFKGDKPYYEARKNEYNEL